jgi:hypothetical protein
MLQPSLTETEAAQYLTDAGIETHPQTLRTWRHRGKGPPYLRLPRIRYRTTDLDLFVDSCRVVPGEIKPKRTRKRQKLLK